MNKDNRAYEDVIEAAQRVVNGFYNYRSGYSMGSDIARLRQALKVLENARHD